MSEQIGSAGTELMERIKKNSGMVITIGVVLLIIGILAIASPFVAGLSIAITIGILLIMGGIGQLFFAFTATSFDAFKTAGTVPPISQALKANARHGNFFKSGC